MSHRLLRPASALPLLAILAGTGAGARAQGLPALPPLPATPPPAHAPGQHGLSDAVRRAQRAGQVLSAEQVQYDGRDVNRVKIVDDQGRVRVYWDDPEAAGREGNDGRDSAASRQPPRNPRQRSRTRHDDDAGSNL